MLRTVVKRIGRQVVVHGRGAVAVPDVITCGRCLSTDASPYKEGVHRSNAEQLVNAVSPIEVEGHIAVCDGGGGALGHPLEYIQLDTINPAPAVCKYCGLRYVQKAGDH